MPGRVSSAVGADGKVASVSYEAEKGDDDTGAVGVAERMKKANVGASASKADAGKPVQGPGESLESLGARMRAWRESRGAAVTGMMKKP